MLLKHAVAVVTLLSPVVLLAQAPGAPSGSAQPPGIHDLALKGDLEAVTALLAADPALLEAEKPPNKMQLADIPILDDGLGYAIRSLAAGAFFPGHARGREHIYLEVAAALKKAGIETPVYCAEFGGDRFTVRPRAGSHLPR